MFHLYLVSKLLLQKLFPFTSVWDSTYDCTWFKMPSALRSDGSAALSTVAIQTIYGTILPSGSEAASGFNNCFMSF